MKVQINYIWLDLLQMREKNIGIPDVHQQEISLQNNHHLKDNHDQVNRTKRMLILVIILLVILVIFLVAIFINQSKKPELIQSIPVLLQNVENDKNDTILDQTLHKTQSKIIQDSNQIKKIQIKSFQSPVLFKHTQLDEKELLVTFYNQNLIENRDIYAFLKKRVGTFTGHLSPYLKMSPIVLKQQLRGSRINNQKIGRAVRLMGNAPLIRNNSEIISKALKLQQQYYESKYNISSYPQIQFCVIVPTFNNVNKFRYFMNLYTIMQQQYDLYHVVIIDDASQDRTANRIQKQIKQNPYVSKRVTLIRNSERQFHMSNIYKAVHKYCKSGQILMIVDGDDELVGRQVFKLFNAAYHKTKAFTIFSNHIKSKKDISLQIGISQAYPQQIIKDNSFRQSKHYYSHLKTAWVDLFLLIKQESLKSKQGKWYDNAVDNAIFLSIFQMACGKIEYLPQITYKYNTFTGNNIAAKDYNYRKVTADEIKAKEKYKCINQTQPQIYKRLLSYTE